MSHKSVPLSSETKEERVKKASELHRYLAGSQLHKNNTRENVKRRDIERLSQGHEEMTSNRKKFRQSRKRLELRNYRPAEKDLDGSSCSGFGECKHQTLSGADGTNREVLKREKNAPRG